MPITGTEGKDELFGTSGDDIIDGLGGNDRLGVTTGSDQIDGGAGSDELFVNYWLLPLPSQPQSFVLNPASFVAAGGLVDTTFTNIETVTINLARSNLDMTVDARTYTSGNNSEFVLNIWTGAGNDIVFGSAMSDFILVEAGRNYVDAGAGFDLVRVAAPMTTGSTVYVTMVNGVVQTTQGGVVTNQILNAEQVWVYGINQGGTIQIDASGLTGFSGQLILGDNNGSDIIRGSSGTDIFANVDDYTLGRDVFTGNGGADVYDYTYAVDGMDGDTITDFDYDDVIDLRNNSIDGQAYGHEEIADHFIGNAAFSGTVGEYRYEVVDNQTLVQVDHTGDGIADETLIIANGAFDLAETFAGSNILQIAGERVIGSTGGDELTGTEGIDLINGNLGADSMFGYGGNDVYYVDNAGDQAVEASNDGIDSVYSSVSFTLAANVENLTLTDASTANGLSSSAAPAPALANGRTAPGAQSAETVAISATGNALANVITGNSQDNVLSGEGGNDTLVGGAGADLLIGGEGQDTLTGGEGRDTFLGTAAEMNGDTITDLHYGDRIVITDATLATFEQSLAGSTLSFSGGSLTLGGGVAGPFVVSAAPEGGVQLTLAPPTRASLTLTEGGQDYTVGGNVMVYGTAQGGEVISVLHGNVQLDASFNLGGDAVVLPGDAADYIAIRSGSFVTIEGNGVSISIPVGISGVAVHFDDSTRTLRFDLVAQGVMLGEQYIQGTVALEAGGDPPPEAVTIEGPDSLGRLVLAEAGQDIDIGGSVTIFGTGASGETVTVLSGTVVLDASFNAGGDTVVLGGDAASYTASRSGSFVTITDGDVSVSIPVGIVGLTVDFADGDRMLRFDTTTGQVMLGDQAVTATSTAVQLSDFDKMLDEGAARIQIAGHAEAFDLADVAQPRIEISEPFYFG